MDGTTRSTRGIIMRDTRYIVFGVSNHRSPTHIHQHQPQFTKIMYIYYMLQAPLIHSPLSKGIITGNPFINDYISQNSQLRSCRCNPWCNTSHPTIFPSSKGADVKQPKKKANCANRACNMCLCGTALNINMRVVMMVAFADSVCMESSTSAAEKSYCWEDAKGTGAGHELHKGSHRAMLNEYMYMGEWQHRFTHSH